MSAIVQGNRPPRPTHPTFTDNLWKLMQSCWDDHPSSRPEAREVLEVLQTPEDPSWKRLISDTLTPREHVTLISAIFSDNTQIHMVRRLDRNDAQSFIDLVYETLDVLTQPIRLECLRSLYEICGHHGIVPRSLTIPPCYNARTFPLYEGAFANVWKGNHQGKEVYVKVLGMSVSRDPERSRQKFCREVMTWKLLRHPNVLPLIGVTMTTSTFAMVSEWMVNGNIVEFVRSNPDTNRLDLLGDVTSGLIHMHDQGIVHGHLKGTNVLINNDRRACLADFMLLTIGPELSSRSRASNYIGSSVRWMSPELITSENPSMDVGLTMESDRYTLGMVIYEVLSGVVPFHEYREVVALLRILRGMHPERPRGTSGVWFTDQLWDMLLRCWDPEPSNRPGLDVILQCLQDTARPPRLAHEADGSIRVDLDGVSTSKSGMISTMNAHVHADPQLTDPPQTTNPKKGGVLKRWKERMVAKYQKHRVSGPSGAKNKKEPLSTP